MNAACPKIDMTPCHPFDFTSPAIRIPAGVRIFSIAGKPVVVPGPDGATRVYLHPDDVATVRNANA